MTKDTPSADPPPTIRAKNAHHGAPATILSWLSTALYLFSVPGSLGLAYLGHRAGFYPYPYTLLAFAVLMVCVFALVFTIMRYRTTIR